MFWKPNQSKWAVVFPDVGTVYAQCWCIVFECEGSNLMLFCGVFGVCLAVLGRVNHHAIVASLTLLFDSRAWC